MCHPSHGHCIRNVHTLKKIKNTNMTNFGGFTMLMTVKRIITVL